MHKLQNSKQNSSQIIILCLNPQCTANKQRCLDSRTIRTHPSDCSRYYFSADTITSMHWSQIPDYPADPLGISVCKKINKAYNGQEKKSTPYFKRLIGNYQQKICKILQSFSNKFEQFLPSTCLEDYYCSTFSLDSIAKYISEQSNPEFIAKNVNASFTKNQYGELKDINQKLDKIVQVLENIVEGFKNQLNGLLDSFLIGKERAANKSYRVQQGILKAKIEFGLAKSKFIASSKIQCVQGRISFPKLENIASFLPWVYTDRGFSTGIHELRIISQKFATVSNSGLCILQEHDIDTYPYHYFKSLFSKQGKGFTLSTYDIQDPNPQTRHPRNYSEIQHTIGQTTEIILRLELNTKPRAILRDAQRTCLYICELPEGKKYRMGIYGSGWLVSINQLW